MPQRSTRTTTSKRVKAAIAGVLDGQLRDLVATIDEALSVDPPHVDVAREKADVVRPRAGKAGGMAEIVGLDFGTTNSLVSFVLGSTGNCPHRQGERRPSTSVGGLVPRNRGRRRAAREGAARRGSGRLRGGHRSVAEGVSRTGRVVDRLRRARGARATSSRRSSGICARTQPSRDMTSIERS